MAAHTSYANSYMEVEVGISLKDRQTILDRIFRKDGLTESKEVDVLNRITGVQNSIDIHDRPTNRKTFKKYFNNKSLPMLDAHIIKPSMEKSGQTIMSKVLIIF